MRIVFVTHQYPPHYNTGTELYAKRMALKLRGSLGHDVRVFTYEPAWRTDEPAWRLEDTVDDGVAVTRAWAWNGLLPNAPLGHYYNVFLGKEFGRYLDVVRPDVVHVFHAAFLGASVIEEAYLRDIPVVVNLMDFWFVCPTAQLLKRRTRALCEGPATFECLECLSVGDGDYGRLMDFARFDGFLTPPRETLEGDAGLCWNNDSPQACLKAVGARRAFLQDLLRLADRVVAPSETLRRIFTAQGHDPRRMQVCRYGVDPMPGYTFDRTPSTTLRIGFIGSINRPKGLHLLVEAVTGLEGDLSLDIHGNPGMFPDYAEECFARARTDPRIRIRGAMQPEHAPTALRDIDVLVVPSLWLENTPFVVLEARAAGVPVVAADVGGIAEIVEDGRNGRLFQAGSVDSLRAVLRDLLHDRAQVQRLSGQIAGTRTLLANALDFTRMYEALIASRSGPVPALAAPAAVAEDGDE